ncbi:MAG: HPr family phosphocarrier protein [Oscillospiraceae bacterium]|jgi:phosphocarrier protein|nr:HPr family phosphocarrier protein [Oscillospiraceae bacterium]
MIRREVAIINPEGLQSQAAVLLVQTACRFNARIRIEQGTKIINAKSMMGVLSLGVAREGTFLLCVDGEDEQAAMAALLRLIESGFAESPRK